MTRQDAFPWEYTNEHFDRVFMPRIYDKGTAGQLVVLSGVGLGDDHPFGKLPQPITLKILERTTQKREGLTDTEGYTLLEPKSNVTGFVIGSYLTDVAEWVQWADTIRKHEIRQVNKSDEKVKIKLDLCLEILKSQGIKVVTQEQLDELGIKVS